MPYDEQCYYEVKKRKEDGFWQFRIYHYDASGNKQIFIHKSAYKYVTKEAAEDAACKWAEYNNIDAEMS